MSPVADPSNIGNVLKTMGSINLDKLRSAVWAQMAEKQDERLGAVLVEMGAITSEELATALQVQETMRAGRKLDAALMILDFQVTRYRAATNRQEELVDQLDNLLVRLGAQRD